MNAMKLSEEERNRVLLVGGYLPTDKEIEQLRKRAKSLVDRWLYPASILDFSWRVIYSNSVLYKVFDINQKQQQGSRKKPQNILSNIFDPDFILNTKSNLTHEREMYLVRMLAHFRNVNASRVSEKWYSELISSMMNNDLFNKTWQKSQTYELDQEIVDVLNFGEKYVMPPQSKKKLHFNFFVIPIFRDPRFTIEFSTPADLDTFTYFEKK
jgi:hypothetical protein